MLISNAFSLMALALSLGKSVGNPWWTPPSNFELPECPGVIEERHYNINVEVLNLPETCTDEQLVVVGWLIEDTVEDMEEMMPEYQVSLSFYALIVESSLSLYHAYS